MKIQLRSADIPALLDQAPEGISWLSLDCFDTLLWRDTAAPVDVFADLDFPGGAIEPRRRAEGAARHAAKLFRDSYEVSIEEIHQRLRPGQDAAASAALELAAEARHCYGFKPVTALIEQAKARGLSVMIVSDTYLSEDQLRALIAAAAGEHVAAQIDRIFASSAWGVNKGNGLFTHVLEELGVDPSEILHLGDNHAADQIAPDELGIHTAHLVQFDEQAKTRLRLEAAAGTVIDPAIRVTRPAFQPHRPALALRTESQTGFALGHDVLGPILRTYAHWLRDERDAIAARTGRKTHLLFLLRDGFLPGQVFDTLFPDETAQRVEISRQTASRAGLIDEAAVRARLLSDGKRNTIGVMAAQLHFKQGELARLGKLDRPANDPAFVEAVLRPETIGQITHRSARFADRLIAHLQRAGVAAGDAVIFADLGYHGSVQDKVAAVLAARMGLSVHGRYLLLREEQPTGLDKQGLFDTRHYDFRTVDALCDAIAVVEQLCTIAQGSVVDYKWDGAPVRKAAGIKSNQSATRDRVQAGAVSFAASAALGLPGDADTWRSAAGAALARLLFLPTPQEVDVLRCFDHDVNLGTEMVVPLLDPAAAHGGLKARGLPYLMHADRLYIPGEIREHGLALNLSMLAWRRFGLEMTTGDMAGAAMTIPVILADAKGETMIEGQAQATHEGFYAMAIPVGASRFTIGIQWGAVLDCVQIDSARFHVVETFGSSTDATSVAAMLMHDGLETIAGNLHRCTGPAALTLAPPPNASREVELLLHIVFRPVVKRGEAQEMAKAA